MLSNATKHLTRVFADTYVLYYQTQACHWNIEGSHFFELHKAFEAQYENLQDAVDELAERLRAIGVKAPLTLKALLSFSGLTEMSQELSAKEMLKVLHDSHVSVSNYMRQAMDELAQGEDPVTADLFMQRLHWHHKIIWMLKSQLS